MISGSTGLAVSEVAAAWANPSEHLCVWSFKFRAASLSMQSGCRIPGPERLGAPVQWRLICFTSMLYSVWATKALHLRFHLSRLRCAARLRWAAGAKGRACLRSMTRAINPSHYSRGHIKHLLENISALSQLSFMLTSIESFLNPDDAQSMQHMKTSTLGAVVTNM